MSLTLVKTRGKEIKKIEITCNKIKKLVEKKLAWDMPVWRIKYILGLYPLIETNLTFHQLKDKFLAVYADSLADLNLDEEGEIKRKKITDSNEYGEHFLQLLNSAQTPQEAEEGTHITLAIFDSVMFEKRWIEVVNLRESKRYVPPMNHRFLSEISEHEWFLKKADLSDTHTIIDFLPSLEVWHPARKIIIKRLIQACTTPTEVKKIFNSNDFSDPYGIELGSALEKLCSQKYQELLPRKKSRYKAKNYEEAWKVINKTSSDNRFEEAYKEAARLGTYEQLMEKLETLDYIEAHNYILAYRCVELSQTVDQALRVAELVIASDDVFWEALQQVVSLAKTSKEIDLVLKKIKQVYASNSINPVRKLAIEKRIKMTHNVSDLLKFCQEVHIEDDFPEQLVVIKQLYTLLQT